MENYRQIIGAIIVFFLSIFITQNVNAFTVSTQVEPTENSWDFSDSYYQYLAAPLANQTWQNYTSQPGVLRVDGGVSSQTYRLERYGIRPTKKITVKEGYYYSTQLMSSWTNPGGTTNNSMVFVVNHFVNDNDFSVVSWDGGTCLTNEEFIQRVPPSSSSVSYSYDMNFVDGYSCTYDIVLRAKHDGEVYFQLGNGTQLFLYADSNLLTYSAWKIQPVQELMPVDSTAQAEEKTEEQSEEGQNNADQADSDNEQATSSLLDIATGILGALTSSPTGNCTFDADLGNVDFGELNLCSGKPPEFAPVIDVVIMLMIIPLIFMTSVSLVRDFINLTKFAQGGD